MENRANYFYIGVFVFGVFFASLFFMIWLGGFSHKEKFDYYQILTRESIAGIGVKTPVRLLGVDVGSVEETHIDTSDGIGVKIIIKLKEGTPVMQNTYANFALQGITGLKYIELKADEQSPALPLQARKDEMPTIKVKASFLSTINEQGNKISNMIDFLDERLKVLFSDTNIRNFSLLLKHFANLNENLDPALNHFSQASQKMAVMAENYSDIKGSLASSLELLEQLLIQMNETMSNLEKSPSDIFFKRGKNKPAPGE